MEAMDRRSRIGNICCIHVCLQLISGGARASQSPKFLIWEWIRISHRSLQNRDTAPHLPPAPRAKDPSLQGRVNAGVRLVHYGWDG